ncbi:MAG: phage portal protein [Gammaproteobacteria bacterium]|nr:phage portal protein [Gammaproteobacteria bacterium]
MSINGLNTHRFFINENQELTFALSGRFRDSDLIPVANMGTGKEGEVQEDDLFTKEPDSYYSIYDMHRVMGYRHNKLLYLGDHFDVFRYFRQLLDSNQISARTGGYIDNRNKLIVYITVNLLGLISRKMADLIAVETPDLLPPPTKKTSGKFTAAIERIYFNSKFPTTLYGTALTLGPKGDAIWVPDVFTDPYRNKQVRIKRIMPETWFPTLDPQDMTKIIEHIFAWKITVDEQKTILRRQIYGNGYIYHRANWINESNKIGAQLTEKEEKKHLGKEGLPEDIEFKTIGHNLVTHIPNLVFDEQHPFGISDYVDLKGPMDEINHRLTQLATELDKHANLSMAGPQLGIQESVVGRYFEYSPDQNAPHYIQLPTDSLNKMMDEVEMHIKYIMMLSEIAPGLLGLKEGAAPERAEALRMQFSNSVVKAMRKRLFLTEAIQKAYNDAFMIENELNINSYSIPGLIRVNWKDGFPESKFEKAEYAALRTGGRPTLSVEDAVRYQDGESAEKMLHNLQEEQKAETEELSETPPEETTG